MSAKTQLEKKNKKLLLGLFAFVAFMVGVSFAAVPLYDLFCRVTGFGGTPQVADANMSVVADRQIRVRFNTDTHRDLPWHFAPEMREVKVNLGQNGLINFKAQNKTRTPMTGTAIYNVTPLKAGKYFVKTQCFCFEEQTLTPGQAVNMPVMFYVDPAMQEDLDMQDVSVITLSYSFFQSNSEELEKAIFEN